MDDDDDDDDDTESDLKTEVIVPNCSQSLWMLKSLKHLTVTAREKKDSRSDEQCIYKPRETTALNLIG